MTTTQKDLKIGQVVYVVSDSSGSVIPAVVAEESIVKTLNGNTVSWKLFIGPEDKRKVIDSRQVNGIVYSSISEVHKELFKRLNDFLSGTIAETKERAQKWYGSYYKEEDIFDEETTSIEELNNLSSEKDIKIDPESLLNSVGETTASTNKSPTSKKQASNAKKPTKKSLREMIMPSEEELKNNIIDIGVQEDNGIQ